MILPATYNGALLLIILSMICWGSWANTFKMAGKWRFELFYWSNVKGRWTTFGNLGRMKLMLVSAHKIVENDPMFRVPHSR